MYLHDSALFPLPKDLATITIVACHILEPCFYQRSYLFHVACNPSSPLDQDLRVPDADKSLLALAKGMKRKVGSVSSCRLALEGNKE